jgi:glucokinase
VGLAAQDARELSLLQTLRTGREHVSVEHALSGPGIAALYVAIAASRGVQAAPLEPNDVIEWALRHDDEIAVEALTVFVIWLGRFAGDAALLFGAKGGVYLGGGIAPKIAPLLADGAFRAAFERKGCMTDYLALIPVYAILADFAALRGAAVALRERLAAPF